MRQPELSYCPMIYLASTWVIPVLLAITLHEAAHGFVAHHFGDDTAWQLGRVSLNPLRHIDPFGTLFLPALLLSTQAPFLFGYADRKSTRLNSSHTVISYAVFCLKKKKKHTKLLW